MTSLREVLLRHEFSLKLICSIPPSPCPTCKVKHILRLRALSCQILATVDYLVCYMLRNGWPVYILRNGWPGCSTCRETKLSIRILDDCRIFRDSIVAKILQEHNMNRFNPKSVGSSSSHASKNAATKAMSDEEKPQKVHCIICRDPLRRLMGSPITSHIYLRRCLTCLILPVRKHPVKSIPRKALRSLGMARICMCGARYEQLHNNSYIDGTLALIRLWKYIITFV